MKVFFRGLLIVGIGIVALPFHACERADQKGERLARTQCSSCHAFPDPSLLSKDVWEQRVFPQMAFRMGLESLPQAMDFPVEDLPAIKKTMPTPTISRAEFDLIKEYYLKNSKDSLTIPESTTMDSLRQFDAHAIRLRIPNPGLVTMVRMDTLHHELFVGDRFSRLYQLNQTFAIQDSLQLSSPPSFMYFDGHDDPILSLIGDVNPTDKSKGAIVSLSINKKAVSSMLDSLKRPVYTQSIDLNNDSRKDLVVCAFGNYTGALLVYQAKADGTYEQHVLSPLAGARKVVVQDVDKNGLPDILALMSKGDENIILFSNYGNFNFKQTTLLRFPPGYGSSDFEMKDIDHDGSVDILYANGDNSVYAPILKPYHGLRLFRNDGKNNFKESWFYALHGASQVHAYDYDQDGDMDLAAIAFSPDYKNEPEKGFVYFENEGGSFHPSVTPLAVDGRWITIESTDVDQDGDCDIVLGAANLNSDGAIPSPIFSQWQTHKTTLLYLENVLRK